MSPRQVAPFYESPRAADAGARRILLISHPFPPDPAVGGVRWQEMSRYLTHRGWAVDVISRDFSKLPHPDPHRLHRLDTGVRLYSVVDREPALLSVQRSIWPIVRRVLGGNRKLASDALSRDEIFNEQGPRGVVRAYHAWMEFVRDGLWARDAARIGAQLARRVRYDAVITSGPPHMAHDAGRTLSQRLKIPHIVDMRDPWSLVQRLREDIASPTWVRLARRFESRIIANAKAVVMNTEPASDAMRSAYPEFRDKFVVIRNGSDDEQLPTPVRDGCFRVRFAGVIYLDRDPRPVFRATRMMLNRLKLTPSQFKIEFIGQANVFSNTPTMQIAEEEGISEYVTVGGLLPRAKALEFLANATMLLSLPQDSDYAVPAKIYEYVRFPSWMLVLASPASATAGVLRGTDADIVEGTDIEGIALALEMRYREFEEGVEPRPVNRDGRFNRSVQASRMESLIEARLPVTQPS